MIKIFFSSIIISLLLASCSKNKVSTFEKNQIRVAAGESLRDSDKVKKIVREVENDNKDIKQIIHDLKSLN